MKVIQNSGTPGARPGAISTTLGTDITYNPEKNTVGVRYSSIPRSRGGNG